MPADPDIFLPGEKENVRNRRMPGFFKCGCRKNEQVQVLKKVDGRSQDYDERGKRTIVIMALSEYERTLIESFLDGTLNADLQQDFQRRMHDSHEFKSEVELAESVLSTWKNVHDDSVTKEIKEIYLEAKAEGLNKSHFTHRISAPILYAAAVIFIALFVSLFYNFWNVPPLNEELYASYYQPFPADPNVRGGDLMNKNSGMNEYRDENYKSAIPLFESAIKATGGPQRLNLFLGICYLETGDFSNAEMSFKDAASIQDAILRQNAEWYLAMTYLKANDLNNCVAQLQKIATSSPIFAQDSRRLLDLLEDK